MKTIQRILLWAGGAIVVVLLGLFLSFKLSPWPAVFILGRVFAKGDEAFEASLQKHVPAGVVERRNLAYGAGKDEIFDLFYRADAAGPRPAIVWIHGGAWIAGNKDSIANYLKVLAGHGYSVVGVEYSSGFGSRYPKPVRQVNAALGYLTRHAADLNIDPNSMILAGDSAGAQLAAQVAIITTDPAYAQRMDITPTLAPSQLAAVLLLSGAYDMESIDFNSKNGWFPKTVLWAYSGVNKFMEDEQFKLISVTRYVTAAFPRAFISSGNGDPLAPQAVALAQRLKGLGVPVDTLFFPAGHAPSLPHEYQFNLDDPDGQLALERMLAFSGALHSHVEKR